MFSCKGFVHTESESESDLVNKSITIYVKPQISESNFGTRTNLSSEH